MAPAPNGHEGYLVKVLGLAAGFIFAQPFSAVAASYQTNRPRGRD
jgi:hypothetical protein